LAQTAIIWLYQCGNVKFALKIENNSKNQEEKEHRLFPLLPVYESQEELNFTRIKNPPSIFSLRPKMNYELWKRSDLFDIFYFVNNVAHWRMDQIDAPASFYLFLYDPQHTAKKRKSV
jgi:hypothetical protein